ncbi:asparagine synthase (glutamine-hydrolyzing) [Aneurinibacillus thermoaerophilus]|uniref:asparagine synthase (glutamine-hydrolyzing) n=1 Tax=Aneurinibacillus thermoaerophilus TaxID=143495 RepID=A0ABX8YB26_ANETH|nr:asparagine synthase (glutamine-hydrolyzing) [Aneurinibacillus thermoaerophilus]QYY42544.1 asparagine synthase (glutamine-hydrolyzing) [Aneurinibacillus thermoaerophilus]
MCGFVGVFDLNKVPINLGCLCKMRDMIIHRGPDDEGIYIDHNLGLGFRRLSIIDVELGHQPMTTVDGRYTIVFNGEIYNYVELRTYLVRSGVSFKTESDTEVLLHLFAQKGKDCLSLLNGMFAFAIWDKEKRELFIARDRMGIKPLYYYADHERFIFASEIKAIIADRTIRREPNYPAILDYLSFMYIPGDKTFFKGIHKLMPGHYAIVGENKPLQIEQYWDITFNYAEKTEKQFVEELRSVIDDAVRIHLRSDVPVGCHLSGGLDSSTVTCLAAKHLQKPFKTFSGKFTEDEFYDETKYAKVVSKAANTTYLETVPSKSFFQKSLHKLVWHMDEPCVGPGIIPQYAVCQLAAKNVKVALGGQGGDEIFGGYPRYFFTYEKSTGFTKSINTQQAIEQSLLKKLANKFVFVKGYMKQHGIKTTIEKIRKNLMEHNNGTCSFEDVWRKYSSSFANASSVFSETLRTQLAGYNPDEAFFQFIRKDVTDDIFDKMLYHDMKAYLPGLLQVEDRMSMAVSLESRVPMLDYRIVELAATIPPHMKVKGLEPKYIFKKAIEGIIPNEILHRKDKKGFPTPINVWFEEDKEFVADILLDKNAKQRSLFDDKQIEKLIASSSAYSWALWSMINIEMWFKIFIDEDPRYVDSDGKAREEVARR